MLPGPLAISVGCIVHAEIQPAKSNERKEVAEGELEDDKEDVKTLVELGVSGEAANQNVREGE